MVELKKWRLRLDDNGDFILHGLAKYGVVMSKPATKKNIQRIALETSFLQVHINNSIYRLWFRDADLSKPITPMRVMKRQPGESCLDAVYCLLAEVSYYLYGFEKEVNRDYLKNTMNFQKYFGDTGSNGNEDDFQLETAIDILLQAGGVS